LSSLLELLLHLPALGLGDFHLCFGHLFRILDDGIEGLQVTIDGVLGELDPLALCAALGLETVDEELCCVALNLQALFERDLKGLL